MEAEREQADTSTASVVSCAEEITQEKLITSEDTGTGQTSEADDAATTTTSAVGEASSSDVAISESDQGPTTEQARDEVISEAQQKSGDATEPRANNEQMQSSAPAAASQTSGETGHAETSTEQVQTTDHPSSDDGPSDDADQPCPASVHSQTPGEDAGHKSAQSGTSDAFEPTPSQDTPAPQAEIQEGAQSKQSENVESAHQPSSDTSTATSEVKTDETSIEPTTEAKQAPEQQHGDQDAEASTTGGVGLPSEVARAEVSAECSADVKPESCGETKPSEVAAAAASEAASGVKTGDAAKDDTGTRDEQSAKASTDTVIRGTDN